MIKPWDIGTILVSWWGFKEEEYYDDEDEEDDDDDEDEEDDDDVDDDEEDDVDDVDDEEDDVDDVDKPMIKPCLFWGGKSQMSSRSNSQAITRLHPPTIFNGYSIPIILPFRYFIHILPIRGNRSVVKNQMVYHFSHCRMWNNLKACPIFGRNTGLYPMMFPLWLTQYPFEWPLFTIMFDGQTPIFDG